jgi:hypothetical protein
MQHTRLFENPSAMRKSWRRVLRAKVQRSRPGKLPITGKGFNAAPFSGIT